MELWLLGGGAIILVGIALWLVWPAHSADSVGDPVRGEEVSTTLMTEGSQPGMPPVGNEFEDQYTSATADLSAGGIAATLGSLGDDGQGSSPTSAQSPDVSAREPLEPSGGQRWPEADTEGEPIGYASRVENFPLMSGPTQGRSGFGGSKTIGAGTGLLLTLGGMVGGAWLYARWQRERNKPINRLRRRAHDMASRLGERLPDVDDVPVGAAPMSGAASALLLAALLATRALHRPSTEDRLDEMRERAPGLVSRPEQAGRRQPIFLGLGFGGLAVVAAGGYVLWRLLRAAGANPQPTWYADE
jgi:hypothetical protein